MRGIANTRLRLVMNDDMPTPLPVHFDRFLTYLAKNERRAPNTIKAREVALRSFADYCQRHGRDPLRASEQDLLGWQASLDLSPGTVANYSQGVSRAFRWLASRSGGKVIAEDPSQELPTIRVITAESAAIDDADLQFVLRAAEHDSRLYTWLLLEAGTGIRPCQMASLTRQRVRYEPNGRAVLTVTGKGSTMAVVAGPDIATVLRQWTRVERGALWHHANGGPVAGSHISYAVNKHLARMGVEATSHSLRRWFAKHAYLLTGKDVRTVSELLGHRDPRTTMRYIPADERGRGDVADLLAARLIRQRTA